ncbi:MAG: hypothetical protein M3680_02975 [Myxococcota bacterium]|nr:hypothetical protein [Myxococcota bacterium]
MTDVSIPASPPAGVPATPAGPRAPLAAWFGQWNLDTEAFQRKTRFFRVEGETFGWRIRTRCTGPVKFREVMRMPRPGDWRFTPEQLPGTTISADQATATTLDYAACRAGWVEHVWTLSADDPAGTYVITVELEGYTPQTFRPRFVEPPGP